MKQYGHFTCRKCGVSKPLTPQYYHRHANCRNGYQYVCKECVKIYSREYYGAPKYKDQERKLYKGPVKRKMILDRMMGYYADPEKRKEITERHKAYKSRPEIKARIAANKRDMFANNPEFRKKTRAYQSGYYRSNREKLRKYYKEYYIKNKERTREKQARYREQKKRERAVS